MLNIPFTPSFVDACLMELKRISRAHDQGTMRDGEAVVAFKNTMERFRVAYERSYPQQMRALTYSLRKMVEHPMEVA